MCSMLYALPLHMPICSVFGFFSPDARVLSRSIIHTLMECRVKKKRQSEQHAASYQLAVGTVEARAIYEQ